MGPEKGNFPKKETWTRSFIQLKAPPRALQQINTTVHVNVNAFALIPVV